MTTLEQELARFDPTLPLEEASTPPSSWYVRPDFFRIESERVFAGNWICAARTAQLEENGSFVSGILADQPWVIVRGDDGELRAFFNVCRHHATAVADGAGCATELVCPYHGWTYGLDGTLSRAPGVGGVKNFDRSSLGLVPLEVDTWGPFVFIRVGYGHRNLQEDLEPLNGILPPGELDGYRFLTRRVYRLNCNWKVFVDNYLDGGYHVPHMHPDLAARLDLESYQSRIFDRVSVQSSGGTDDDRIRDGAVYAWIHPNLMINRYGRMMDTNLVVPIDAGTTDVVFEWFDAESGDPPGLESHLAASEQVQKEDTTICESVQKGLQSRGYDCGRYAVPTEAPEHHFHQVIWSDLREG